MTDEVTYCPKCGDDMPAARLTIEVANGVCEKCNNARPRAEYAQACYGFKNNGANLVKTDDLADHAVNVKVVG